MDKLSAKNRYSLTISL